MVLIRQSLICMNLCVKKKNIDKAEHTGNDNKQKTAAMVFLYIFIVIRLRYTFCMDRKCKNNRFDHPGGLIQHMA